VLAEMSDYKYTRQRLLDSGTARPSCPRSHGLPSPRLVDPTSGSGHTTWIAEVLITG
jgi:hypothetical protein